MNIRKTLKYPPYYYLAHLEIKSKNYEEAKNESAKVAHFLERKLDKTSIILGPTTANMFRINNVYHFEIMIIFKSNKKAAPRFELGVRALQAPALPLGHAAIKLEL